MFYVLDHESRVVSRHHTARKARNVAGGVDGSRLVELSHRVAVGDLVPAGEGEPVRDGRGLAHDASVAHRVRHYRGRSRVSDVARKWAAATGRGDHVAIKDWSRFESGARVPTVVVLAQLAWTLDVDPGDLVPPFQPSSS